jgi:hypothetical protein
MSSLNFGLDVFRLLDDYFLTNWTMQPLYHRNTGTAVKVYTVSKSDTLKLQISRIYQVQNTPYI